jgi:hypothetical protein
LYVSSYNMPIGAPYADEAQTITMSRNVQRQPCLPRLLPRQRLLS